MYTDSKEREYQFCLQRVRTLEGDFLKLRESLRYEQQILLDDYISACEALSEAEVMRDASYRR